MSKRKPFLRKSVSLRYYGPEKLTLIDKNKYKLSHHTQFETDNLIFINYKRNLICNCKLAEKAISRPRWFHWRILPNVKNELVPVPHRILQKTQEERTFINSFYEVIIFLVSNPYRQLKATHFRLTSFMSTDAKSLPQHQSHQHTLAIQNMQRQQTTRLWWIG